MFRHAMKQASALAFALCVVIWLPHAGRASQAQSATSRPGSLLGGVDIGSVGRDPVPGQADRLIAVAGQLHARIVRTEVRWSEMEPLGPGQIDPTVSAYLDRLTSDASANGIRIIMTVESTPCWVSSAPSRLLRKCVPGSLGQANIWPPTRPGDYAAFVAYLAARYGPQLAALEIWNEPDQINQQYFAGPHKAQRYALILRQAYRAIKQANPNVPVIAGSLVGSNGVFLRSLYAAGIKNYYDGLSVHYYDLTLAALRSIRETQLANGDTKPLWLDEFGWSSCWPRYKLQQEQACVTKQIQATDLVDMLGAIAESPYVAAAVVYKLQGSISEDFGVLTASGSRKPAFESLAQSLVSPFTGNPDPVRLRLNRAGSGVLARGSGPPGDYMRLEVLRGTLLRYRAVFTLDRFNHYSILLPSQLGMSGLSVRVYQYWAGPNRGARGSI
jgi:polysaccharide biosynthesis protein PslG